jgi:tetratricopeptide (TPR) repeat protein
MDGGTRLKHLIMTAITGAICFATITGCGAKYRIKSEPSDSVVTVNGVEMGKTPLDIPFSKLPQDTLFELKIAKEGYGVYSGFVPGPVSGFIGNEVYVKVPKVEDVTNVVNRNTGAVIHAQQLIAGKRYDEALRVLDTAIRENPHFVHPQALRASALFLSKNYTASLAQWNKVLDMDPTNLDARRMVGFINNRGLASAPDAAAMPATEPAVEGAKP